MRRALRENIPTALLGGLLAGVVAIFVNYFEDRAAEESRIAEATTRIETARTRLQTLSQDLVIGSEYASGSNIDPAFLRGFLTQLKIIPGSPPRWIWAPQVAVSDIASHEQQIRNQTQDQGYKVHDIAVAIQNHFPIVMDSRPADSSTVGQDLVSFASVRNALSREQQKNQNFLLYLAQEKSRNVFGSDSILLARLLQPEEALNPKSPPAILARVLSLEDFGQILGLQREQPFFISDVSQAAPVSVIGTATDLANSVFDSGTADLAGRKLRISVGRIPQNPTFPLWAIAGGLTLAATLIYVIFDAARRVGLRADRLFTQLNSTEEALTETRNVEQAFFNSAGTANCETDPIDGRFLRVNDALCSLLGYSREELLQKTFSDVTHSGDLGFSKEIMKDFEGTAQRPVQFEKRYIRKDGSTVWALVNVRPLNDRYGRPKSYATVILDISDRKRDEQIKANLARELAHRVRNTVQLTASLARHTARRARTASEYDTSFRRRLTALNAAQDLLFEADWRGVDLATLAARTLKPFQSAEEDGGNSHRDITISLPAADLPTQHAQTLAIAFHELASNSMKYGTLSEGGHVLLEGRITSVENEGKLTRNLEMSWIESGATGVRKPRRSGFGLTVLTSVLPEQFGGKADLQWKRTGFVYKCWLPLPEI